MEVLCLMLLYIRNCSLHYGCHPNNPCLYRPEQTGYNWLDCNLWIRGGLYTPLKTNMDTQNDGLEKVTPFKNGKFWYLPGNSLCPFWVKWPFQNSSDLQLGDQKVTAWITWYIRFLGCTYLDWYLLEKWDDYPPTTWTTIKWPLLIAITWSPFPPKPARVAYVFQVMSWESKSTPPPIPPPPQEIKPYIQGIIKGWWWLINCE